MNSKKNKVIPRTLTGFMELLPNEQIKFNQMIDCIRNSYEKFGFLPLDTPIIELADVLLAKAGGETEKQIYSFEKGDNNLALRFDLTVPLAKYIAMNYNELSFPFKRYQIGKVYRGERPQKGRFREFYQCDIDIIGDENLSLINDAEILSVIYNTFSSLGFDDFTICINNRKILNGIFESLNLKEKSTEILRIIDKIEKIGEEKVKEELLELNINVENIEILLNFISIKGTTDEKINELNKLNIQNDTFNKGKEELIEVINCVRSLQVPEKCFTIDFTIARGLDYYTGTVYETFLNKYKNIGSVCSGGRYENLAEFYTDKKLPGVGISIGLTRLFYQLSQMNAINVSKKSIADVLVVSMDENISDCLSISTQLRNAGINTEVYLENKKIKTKMKYANKLNIPYVIIIGEEERINKEYTLKNMETGEQKKLKIEDIIKLI